MDLVANVWMTKRGERDARASEPSSSALWSWEKDGFWTHSPGGVPCDGRNVENLWSMEGWSEQRRFTVPMQGSDCEIILTSAVLGGWGENLGERAPRKME